MEIKAGIFAAGKGSRLNSVTKFKPLVTLSSGITPLQVALYSLGNANFSTTNYVVVSSLGLNNKLVSTGSFLNEAPTVLQLNAKGNLVAAKLAIAKMSVSPTSMFMAINADDALCLSPRVIKDYLRYVERVRQFDPMAGVIMLTRNGNPSTHRKHYNIDNKGRVSNHIGFRRDGLYNTGISVLPVIEIINIEDKMGETESRITNVHHKMMANNRLYGYVNDINNWYPMNTPEQYFNTKNNFTFEP